MREFNGYRMCTSGWPAERFSVVEEISSTGQPYCWFIYDADADEVLDDVGYGSYDAAWAAADSLNRFGGFTSAEVITAWIGSTID